jgi:hypothetical protein
MKIVITLILLLSLSSCKQDDFLSRFDGLQAKANYQIYKIFDLVEQRDLPCEEALEFIGDDPKYNYYFNCLKSNQIYFVSDEEVIKVKNFYEAGLITLEELYNLKIIDRMNKE